MQHRLDDETFAYVSDDGAARVFNVSAMQRWVNNNPESVEPIETDIDPGFVEFVKCNRGIERRKVERLCEPFLSMPALACLLDDGTTLTLDGHHRLVRLSEDGRTTYRLLRLSWRDACRFTLFATETHRDEEQDHDLRTVSV